MTEEIWKWNKKRELAAELLAQSLLSLQEIAAKAGVSDTGLRNWRKAPEFQSRVKELSVEFHNRVKSEGIAVWENRVQSYNERWRKMQKVINARAQSEEMQDVPGGDTGLLVHTIKSVGSGESATMVDYYEVDTGLLKEIRAHEEQASKELGQWLDKTEVRNYTEQDVENLSILTDDELKQYISLKQKLAKPGGSDRAAEAPAA